MRKILFIFLLAFICSPFSWALLVLEPQQICTAKSVIDDSNRSLVQINVACTLSTQAIVIVTNPKTQALLCGNSQFAATSVEATACVMKRNPSIRLDYRVEIIPKGTVLGQPFVTGNLVIYKDPTYSAPATGSYSSDILESHFKLAPHPIRGWFDWSSHWIVNIGVEVSDVDADPSEIEVKPIRIQLIDLTDNYGELYLNEKEVLLEQQYANTGEIVVFQLKHKRTNPPSWWGEPYDTGDLRAGDNSLKVRIWDAYKSATFIDLEKLSVSIRE